MFKVELHKAYYIITICHYCSLSENQSARTKNMIDYESLLGATFILLLLFAKVRIELLKEDENSSELAPLSFQAVKLTLAAPNKK